MTTDRATFPPGAIVSRTEARSLGWTDAAIRRALDSGRWVRLHAGRYLVRDDGSVRAIAEARACQSAVTGSVISHSSGALWYGLPLLSPSRLCLSVAGTRRLTAVSGAHLHRARLEGDVAENGIVTTPARTALDVARERGRNEGLVVADAALRLQLTDRAAIDKALRGMSRWPGVRRAAWVARSCDRGAESPLETLSRVKIGVAGLPAPHLQTTIRDRRGRFVGRTDFYWDEAGVVGEADGMQKYATREDLVAEKRRQVRLEQLGLVVVRWTWADLRRFETTAAQIRAALLRPVSRRGERRWLASYDFVRGIDPS